MSEDDDFDFDLDAILAEQPRPEPAEQAPPNSSVESSEGPSSGGHRRLSVHALGQYYFCGRAGVLAQEIGDERDVDDLTPRWDYLPNFTLELIEEELGRQFKRLAIAVVATLVVLAIVVAAMSRESPVVVSLGAVGLVGSLYFVVQSGQVIFTLAGRRWAALHAPIREPSPRIEAPEPVDWWSMRRAGFEPRELEEPLRHPGVPIEGSPWRVLERDSLRIPVIRSGGEKLGPKRGWRSESTRSGLPPMPCCWRRPSTCSLRTVWSSRWTRTRAWRCRRRRA